MRKRPLKNAESVAASLRNSFTLLSPFNDKTVKGEAEGYLTAILYLAPHTLAGGRSVCPHSTPACRAGCLFSAGRGRTPRVEQARLKRTRRFLADRYQFITDLLEELHRIQRVADDHGMQLAIRLNGTSDILWEREQFAVGEEAFGEGEVSDIFATFPRATFYDYTRTPIRHRKVPPNWKLVFSLADEPAEKALAQLRGGQSVAVVVPEHEKRPDGSWAALGDLDLTFIDGDLHDLRFLDPAPALVQLRPKGELTRGGPMVHRGFADELLTLARNT